MKKILCMILGLAMVLSTAFIPVSAGASDANIADKVISQNYEDEGNLAFRVLEGNPLTEIITDETGNTYANVASVGSQADTRVGSIIATMDYDALPSKFIVEFDMKVIDVSGPLGFVIKDPEIGNKWVGISIFAGTFGTFDTTSTDGLINGGEGEDYLMRITVDESKYVPDTDNVNNVFAVSYKKGDSTTWTKVPCITYGSYYDRAGFRPGNKVGNNAIYNNPATGNISFGAMSSAHNSFATRTPIYLFDNIDVFAADATFADYVSFETPDGVKYDEIPQGEVMAKYVVENNGGLSKATAIMTAYDKNGRMLGMSTEEITLSAETVTAYASMDISEYYDELDGGRIETYLWTDTDEQVSLGKTKAVLGTPSTVGSSDTSASIGTDSGMGNNFFMAFDRELTANVLTIEGIHSGETSVAATVTVKGDVSGNIIVADQLSTKDDGSFAKTYEINSELLSGDESATVTVSGINTVARTFGIPVADNWEAMAEDFEALDAESAEEFYNTYKNNLTIFSFGENDADEIDVESLDDEDFENIAFLKAHTEYKQDMSFGEVVTEARILALALDDVAEFEVAFAEAKANEDAAQKVDAIRELLAECSFMEFSTEGVANVDAICREMGLSDAETLIEIYDAFDEAYNRQKNAEEATVPDFTQSIDDGDSLKEFFVNSETVLGVDPEQYSDADYEVMYRIYEEKNYDALTSYGQVNEAIVFLDNYINEYNLFMANIINAATVTKGWEEIKAVLNAEYTYVEIELADETAIVSKEYLYSRLIDMSCESLWTIEEDFADAVKTQTDYEIAAKDAYNTIMDTTAIKAMFAEYGDMMGLGKGKELTDQQLVIFLEVYKRFELVATDYSQTIVHLNTLFEKLAKAEALLADMNQKAESADWAALKTVFEGEEYAELVGEVSSASGINDVRSLYLRVVAYAPFKNLSDAKTAFENSCDAQTAYEAVAGGYESFDDEILYFDDSAWNLSVSGNVVTVSGKVSQKGYSNILLYVQEEASGNMIYIDQIVSEAVGTFKHTFILNPEMYNADDMAVLRLSGDVINTYAFSPFELYDKDELETIVSDFLEISNKTELKAFFDTHANGNGELMLTVDTEDPRVIDALMFAYESEKKAGRLDNIADIDEVLNGVGGKSGIQSLMKQMEEIIKCLEDLTEAANKKMGSSVGRWGKIKDQVQLAIKNGWINPSTSGKVSSESELYLRMTDKTYNYLSDIEEEYESAHSAQVKEESKKPSGGGGGGGGSSSGGGGSLNKPINMVMGADENSNKDTEVEVNVYDTPVVPFTDITSDYSWASESIGSLRKYGFVKGDGNGKYRPADGISREEFLHILLNIFGIERKMADANFYDVDKNAWYYDTVATAYDMGIVNGYPDGTFGIGQTITRADMAVLVCRMLEITKVELAAQKAVEFKDFDRIPGYAYSSVTKLQQGGILNGDTFGMFNPTNNVTRAEAAVVFWSVFGQVKDIVTYSWENVY